MSEEDPSGKLSATQHLRSFDVQSSSAPSEGRTSNGAKKLMKWLGFRLPSSRKVDVNREAGLPSTAAPRGEAQGGEGQCHFGSWSLLQGLPKCAAALKSECAVAAAELPAAPQTAAFAVAVKGHHTDGCDQVKTGRVHRWERGRLLGVGTFGRVNLAEDLESKQLFAVKTVPCYASLPASRKAVAALAHEEEMLGQLSTCAHVIRCLGSDLSVEPDGAIAHNLFLEYMSGGSVADLLSRDTARLGHSSSSRAGGGPPLDEELVRQCTKGILKALDEVHAYGIIHCDVKGQNVLISFQQEDSLKQTLRLDNLEEEEGLKEDVVVKKNIEGEGEDEEEKEVELVVKLADFGAAKYFSLDSNNSYQSGRRLAATASSGLHPPPPSPSLSPSSQEAFCCHHIHHQHQLRVDLPGYGSNHPLSNQPSRGGWLESLRGTVHWMAPEAARGTPLGPKADIWSLGCTIIEMATQEPPWPHIPDPMATLYHIGCTDEIPAFPSNLSPEAHDFLSGCLVRDPDKRWTASQLLAHPFIQKSRLSIAKPVVHLAFADAAAIQGNKEVKQQQHQEDEDVEGRQKRFPQKFIEGVKDGGKE
ncbi:hypothetical protein CBR_g23862 [Chara braunii]|uniref:Protein kinase domain-containing protein n=1 Tax=Chara braunii TaxID=69332 RepID=A0A388L5E1_CHABU|nr:hypothetical protein CBR_g23862 [Chara braunii]|eukprot:GBG77413.1 hypothetical protein CBR_g23862 [Chara braunii]